MTDSAVMNESAKRASGGLPGTKNVVKHELHTYKAMLNGDGLDQRTALCKTLRRKNMNWLPPSVAIHHRSSWAIIADCVKNMSMFHRAKRSFRSLFLSS